jgi:hypothetical protein
MYVSSLMFIYISEDCFFDIILTLKQGDQKIGKNLPNFLKSSQNACQAKISTLEINLKVQNIYIKVKPLLKP